MAIYKKCTPARGNQIAMGRWELFVFRKEVGGKPPQPRKKPPASAETSNIKTHQEPVCEAPKAVFTPIEPPRKKTAPATTKPIEEMPIVITESKPKKQGLLSRIFSIFGK